MFVPVLASCCRLVAVCAADGKESPADSNRRDRWPVWDGDRVAVKKKKVFFCVAHSQLSTKQKTPQCEPDT